MKRNSGWYLQLHTVVISAVVCGSINRSSHCLIILFFKLLRLNLLFGGFRNLVACVACMFRMT